MSQIRWLLCTGSILLSYICTLTSFNVFLPLSSLLKLKHLTLQQPHPSNPPSPHSEPLMRLSNPICNEPAYVATMCELLPSVVWLDQEVVAVEAPGGKFYKECQDIQERNGKWGNEYHLKSGEEYTTSVGLLQGDVPPS